MEAPGARRQDGQREEHDHARIEALLVASQTGGAGAVGEFGREHGGRLRIALPLGGVPDGVAAHRVPDVPVGIDAAQGLVVEIAEVVAVDRVLVEDLPVAVHLVAHVARVDQTAVGQVVGPGVLVESGDPLVERLGRFRVRIDIDHAPVGADGGSMQRQALARSRTEALRLVGHASQRSVRFVCPAVVRAADHGLQVAAALDDLAAAVTADVVEGLELSGFVPEHEQRVVHQPAGAEVPGFLEVLLGGCPDPGAVEQAVDFPVEPGGVEVGLRWQ